MSETLYLENNNNSQEGWINASSQIKNISGYSQVVFQTYISDNKYSDYNDVTNLRYFFPIADYLESKKIAYELIIRIENKSNYTDDLERVKAFLVNTIKTFYFNLTDKSIHILSKTINDDYGLNSKKNKLIQNVDYLNPIISDIKKAFTDYKLTTNESYDDKSEKLFNNITLSKDKKEKKIRNIIINDYISSKDFEVLSRLFTENFEQFVKEFQYSFRFFKLERAYRQASDIFPLTKIDNVSFINFKPDIESYDKWFKSAANYRGSKSISISSELKVKLIDGLVKTINEKSEEENDLTQLIFKALMRNYISDKEIFNLYPDSEPEINYSIIDKIFADAKSYSEGIYQIIENSCLYSYGKCAYFGMRIYNANRNAALSAFEKNSKNRLTLYSKFKHCIPKNTKGEILSNNIFNDLDYSDYLEIYVIDNAFDKIGIVPNYVYKTKNHSITRIGDLISESYESYSDSNDNPEEYFVSHYGLRWFKKIIDKNDGYISILSPNKDNDASFYSSYVDTSLPDIACDLKNIYSTEHNVLLPLSYRWKAEDDNRKLNVNKYIFGNKVSTQNYSFKDINVGISNENDKLSAVKDIYGTYFKDAKKNKADNETNNLTEPECNKYIIDEGYTLRDIEILAKALFLYIYNTYLENSERSLYLVVDFQHKKGFINEFVRIFSIFYDKSERNSFMKNVHIALATTATGNIDGKSYSSKEINFIISGENFNSAYATANVFIYYNSEQSAEYIPLLKYLTSKDKDTSSKKDEEISIFPFDLYLNDNKENENQSWFIDRIDRIIKSDIRNRPYGCKIDNIHIRISSRIHLSTFYEAELLFHNISNVYRFAYLIARDIIQEINNNANTDIFILGYEKYSSILIQQISIWLSETLGNDKYTIHSAIVSTDDDEKERIFYIDDINPTPEICDCYTIIPIGTTMSTIYKLHNIFKNNTNMKSIKFKSNFSIVSVSDEVYCKEDIDNEKNKVVKKYWCNINPKINTIYVQPERSIDDGISVKYYVRAITKWHDIKDCELCNKNIPLIQVDKTSTIPNSIFELSGSNRKFFKTNDNHFNYFLPELTNDMKLNEVVKYAHICHGNNHYQFYFDFERFVINAKKEIIDWASKIDIDKNAYNVVISPLNITNTTFLKIIIENVFSSSLRFLHIDINNTYKEDIRAKFSYISQDYETIKRQNNSAKINFYYVDDSIVTGSTINRGRMLLKMLLDETDIFVDDNIYFKKVFLLINRSSYDTVNTLVENVDTDFHSFCNLLVPSYNTNNNFCPGCSIQKQYDILRKRSTSEMLSNEFARLSNKHMVRTPTEYDRWLYNAVLTNHSYFNMLCSFLYDYVDDEKANRFIVSLKSDMINYLSDKYESGDIFSDYLKFNEMVNKLCINDFINYYVNKYGSTEDDKINAPVDNIITLVHYIISKKSYLRLKTMNKAYKEIEEIAKKHEANNEEIKKAASEKIWNLFANSSDIEELISYIKVISREYISKYYHIRLAVVGVMLELFNAIIDKSFESETKGISDTLKIIKNENNDNKKYVLLITIIHRLAMLQSLEIIDVSSVNMVIACFEEYFSSHVSKYTDDFDEALLLLNIPSKQKMINQFIKSLKTATMMNNDDVLCEKLFELSEKIKEVWEIDE